MWFVGSCPVLYNWKFASFTVKSKKGDLMLLDCVPTEKIRIMNFNKKDFYVTLYFYKIYENSWNGESFFKDVIFFFLFFLLLLLLFFSYQVLTFGTQALIIPEKDLVSKTLKLNMNKIYTVETFCTLFYPHYTNSWSMLLYFYNDENSIYKQFYLVYLHRKYGSSC